MKNVLLISLLSLLLISCGSDNKDLDGVWDIDESYCENGNPPVTREMDFQVSDKTNRITVTIISKSPNSGQSVALPITGSGTLSEQDDDRFEIRVTFRDLGGGGFTADHIVTIRAQFEDNDTFYGTWSDSSLANSTCTIEGYRVAE